MQDSSKWLFQVNFFRSKVPEFCACAFQFSSKTFPCIFFGWFVLRFWKNEDKILNRAQWTQRSRTKGNGYLNLHHLRLQPDARLEVFRVSVQILDWIFQLFFPLIFFCSPLFIIFLLFLFLIDEPPRSQSKLTLLWGAMVKLCAGHYPKLYSYQNSLPRMPVPNLRDTCEALLRSIKPIFDEEEIQKDGNTCQGWFANF